CISKIGNTLISLGNNVFRGISSFLKDGIDAIKSIGDSVKSWFSSYSFLGNSTLGNLNDVGYLGAGIPGVGLGAGLPVVHKDSLAYAGTTIHVSSEPKDSAFMEYV
ncbi:hypothetical protein, partial [Clostridium perfringens]|uniref:hypothetical protein n=1 Tax=Clostridium perfringens TaxID=1502 RepID=UPI002ACC33A4